MIRQFPVRTFAVFACITIFLATAAAEGPWPWSGSLNPGSATLLLLGDFNVQKRTDPADALINVRETLNRADLVYANLEGLLVKSAGPDKDLPDKSGWQHVGPEALVALKAANVKAVGVANNVAYGHANILETLRVLDSGGIAHAGGGANIKEAHLPAIVTQKGVRFGFLQYTSKWYAEADQIATENSPGVARMLSRDGMTVDAADLERLRDDVRKLRSRADLVIVSTHTRDGQGRSAQASAPQAAPQAAPRGSREPDLFSELAVNPRLSETEPYQRELARAAIDAGADIVYGHGCHMLQGVEVYKGKPIMHCMGNFASDWIRVRKYKEGMVARIVVKGKDVLRVSLVPVTRDDEKNNVMMLDPSVGEGARLYQKLKGLSGSQPLPIDGKEIVLLAR